MISWTNTCCAGIVESAMESGGAGARRRLLRREQRDRSALREKLPVTVLQIFEARVGMRAV